MTTSINQNTIHYQGKTLVAVQVVGIYNGSECAGCALEHDYSCICNDVPCASYERFDNKDVIFVEIV